MRSFCLDKTELSKQNFSYRIFPRTALSAAHGQLNDLKGVFQSKQFYDCIPFPAAPEQLCTADSAGSLELALPHQTPSVTGRSCSSTQMLRYQPLQLQDQLEKARPDTSAREAVAETPSNPKYTWEVCACPYVLTQVLEGLLYP